MRSEQEAIKRIELSGRAGKQGGLLGGEGDMGLDFEKLTII